MFISIPEPASTTLRVNGERVEPGDAPFRARFVFVRGEVVAR
jgi:hypothetical protein